MTVKITKPELNLREKISELDKPSGVAGEAMLRAETPQEQQELIGVGRKNLVINGAMRVAQRGTSVTGVTSGQLRTCDRFGAYVNTGTWTGEQVADSPDEFQKSFKITCTTGDAIGAADQVQFFYSFEGRDLAGLAKGTTSAKSFTISFWIKASKTGTSVLNVKDQTNNRHITAEYTIDSPATWEKKSITFPGDITGAMPFTTTADMYLEFWLKAGSDISSGSAPTNWATYQTVNRSSGTTLDLGTSTNDYCQITGIQMELGKVATPFEHRSYGEELALCQRYYQVLANVSSDSLGACSRWNSANVFLFADLPVEMRDVPTLDTNISTSASALATKMAGLTSTHNNLTIDGDSSPRKIRLNSTSVPSGSSDGQAGWMRVNTSGIYVNLSAEL